MLNEQEGIARFVEALIPVARGAEIVIADGDSSDSTLEIASRFPGLRIVQCGVANRGLQLNAGSRAASGNVLLFLHADARLPAGALDSVAASLAHPNVPGGAFHVAFPDGSPASLRLVAWGINLRTRLFASATGDQAIFIRKDIFDRLGGFPDLPLFEDVTLFNSIKRIGPPAILADKVTISPRRWLKFGVWRTVLLMYLLRFGFWLGLDPADLKKLFADVREKDH